MQRYRRSSGNVALTEKQCEAIQLVAEGYTSKEVARILSISPKMVDRRIDAVRQKLGGVSRGEAARIYRANYSEGDNSPGGAIPLTRPEGLDALDASREDAEVFSFADVGSHAEFFEAAPWDYPNVSPVPKFELARFGIGARLAMMGGGALLIAVVLLVLIGVANGLNEMIVS
ncbi:helix-turn-helix transcriptional regulator [Qipengyuania sp. RANM35]|uniref:helix-turn-helix domain-containing protein n=1 Tax=Qipengyuania sp. RANM35 TaxID=3068635 RepID=UPI0034DB4150